MEQIYKRLEMLSPKKRELVLNKLREKALVTDKNYSEGNKPIKIQKRSDKIPLSFAQQRLWILDQFQPGSYWYNLPFAFYLTGYLNASLFEQCLNEVVRRHESLRTTFRIRDGNPFQYIHERLHLEIHNVDIKELSDFEQDEKVRMLAKEEIMLPFDLINGPLIRTTLITLNDKKYALLLTVHHIVFDGWSNGIFIQELTDIFNSYSVGLTSSLAEPTIQYADFAIWQRQWLSDDRLEGYINFWKQKLDGYSGVFEVPTDKVRGSVQTFKGERRFILLPKELSIAIQEFVSKKRVSLFNLGLAAFNVFLQRWSGQDDIVVGTATAGRNRIELEKIIGFFINILILRANLSENPKLYDFLDFVQQMMLDVFSYQDIPFEILVQELQPHRDMSRSPMCQIMYVLQNISNEELKLRGLSLESINVDTSISRYDLVLFVCEKEQGIGLAFEYNSDLFGISTIERMGGHLRNLICAIVRDAQVPISYLPMISKLERHKILTEWSGSTTVYPVTQCIHQWFEAQVEVYPDIISLVYEDHHISYSYLNSRANQLAHYLISQGVSAETIVALITKRSVEMIMAILAVLKAGGVYLPIELNNPKNRVSEILNDSMASMILTQEDTFKEIPFTLLQGIRDVSSFVVVTDSREQIKDIDKLPFPDRTLVDYKKYHKYIGIGYVQRCISLIATRGCPYKCLYCHSMWPDTHVYRTAENIYQEVLYHYDKGYRTFSFMDDIFNLNRNNSARFFNLIIKNKLNIRILFPSGLRGDILSPNYIDLMSEAGVVQMALALETASPRLQKLIRKKINIEKLHESIVYICKNHPHILTDLFTMFGLPTETEAETLTTLDFIKSIEWLHFPLLYVLRIFPNTGMAQLAMQHGVSKEKIEKNANLAYHEISDTLPYSKQFAREYQVRFLSEYFLLPERLKKVIPLQKKVLTRKAMIDRYNSYLPGGLNNYPEILQLIDDGNQFYSEDEIDFEGNAFNLINSTKDQKILKENQDALRILLLDLSQMFTDEADQLNDMVEAPLGVMSLLTYIKKVYGNRINGKILKSMVDFDNFDDLRKTINEFKPQLIGIRSLSFYKEFFHRTVAIIRYWCPEVAIIAGGPYATCEYNRLLSDTNIDIIVRGEGEKTFSELLKNILANNDKIPDTDVLKKIPGLAFIPSEIKHKIDDKPVRRVMIMDKIVDAVSNMPDFNPESRTTIHNAAYLIYTSGSTGKPKGVIVDHANIVRLFKVTEKWFDFDDSDVWTLFHSCAFDFSVWELWGSLIYGGQLVIIPYWLSRSPEEFYNLVVNKQITILNQTPTAFRSFMQIEQETEKKNVIRMVIFGGEALDFNSLRSWYMNHHNNIRLVNMYGISETTVHVTYYPIRSTDIEKASHSIIGKPISDLQIYILDCNLNLVPIGVPGEIYVGGGGLARGYLDCYDLTSERFIPDPFSNKDGARLYRTGDSARYLSDGNLVFWGRLDSQVKIRGFRIELGEIESTLLMHPKVSDAIVLMEENQPNDRCLVAYVVGRENGNISTDEIYEFLSKNLPNYMLPAHVVFLKSLPITANGKIDYKSLPKPGNKRPDLAEEFVSPRTHIEKVLAEIWSKVLGVDSIGVHDNFFVLGGDSIRSIQAVALAKNINIVFTIQELFRYPTIHELSVYLESTIGTKQYDHVATKPFSLISVQDRQKIPEGVEDAYPLAALQAGMLFHSEYDPDSGIYHDVICQVIKCPFDPEIFSKAVEQLIDRHDILRTSFSLNNYSQPLQLVHRKVPIPLEIKDITNMPESAQRNYLGDQFENEKRRSFDISHPPLIQLYVCRCKLEVFTLMLGVHHAILDGWSNALLMAELFRQYFFLLGRENSPLSLSPKLKYRDFVALERETIESNESRRYWFQKMSSMSYTTIPRWKKEDSSRSMTSEGVIQIPLSGECSSRLIGIANQENIPLKSVLLAVHIRLLSIMSNQDDVVTGLVTNGRPEIVDGERILGLFLNTLPFYCKLAGGVWNDLIKEIFEAERDFLPHRRYPLVELLKINNQAPLFDIIFNYNNFHVLHGIQKYKEFQVLEQKFFEKTNFPLLVYFILDEVGAQIHLLLEYDSEEFGDKQIKVLSEYYIRLLNELAERPDCQYEMASILSQSERHKLLFDWNTTAVDYALEFCIHELFEDQVSTSPDVIALVFGQNHLTYGELSHRSNKLAHYLQNYAVGPEVLVGVYLERSFEMVIGLLGILKSGGAYLPLDPKYPSERLKFILQDSQVSVVLSQKSLADEIPSNICHVIRLDCDGDKISQESELCPFNSSCCENLAYSIYTSGSTGIPKGVAIEHRHTVDMLMWARDTFSKDALSGVLASTSICFDMSVFELFVPLCWGGKIILIDSILELPTLVSNSYVTMINTVPSPMSELVSPEKVPSSVSIVNLIGEPLRQWLVDQLYDLGHIIEVNDFYGPAEDTTCTTRALRMAGGSETIGRPISNTQLYILDRYLSLVPLGTESELYIGGGSVVRGYWSRPALTAERFIPDCYGDGHGLRLYRTGDIVHYLSDGNLVFQGRVDHQVKIRGYRIELGEIESLLYENDNVEDVVLFAREDKPGEKRLVAYIVVKCEKDELVSELRNYLRERLPDYMVPSFFVFLEKIPLLPNGKVDRQALQELELGIHDIQHQYVAPRTPTEEILASIWMEVVGVERIGIHDNFFEVGGHSLLAMQVMSRIRDSFDIDLPLRVLFQTPTIADLAEQIDRERHGGAYLVPLITPVKRHSDMPLSFAQKRLWFLDQFSYGASVAYNMPALIENANTLTQPLIKQVINELVRRHESLRTTFLSDQQGPRQNILLHLDIEISLVYVSNVGTMERQSQFERLYKEVLCRRFDFNKGPMLRAALIQFSDIEKLLIIASHHIILDGSIGQFTTEFTGLCEVFSRGAPSPYKCLRIQYADFAYWQNQMLQNPLLNQQLSYWRKQLEGTSTLLQLHTDRPRPPQQSFRGATYVFDIHTSLSERIKLLAQKQNVTLYMIMVAAFKVMLYRYTEQDDIVVGTPITGRNMLDLEQLIGCFNNNLVLRSHLSGNPSFMEYLSQVKTITLDAFAHQDIPFDVLVQKLQTERYSNVQPIFQIMFVLNHVNLDGIEDDVSTMLLNNTIESGWAKFDILLSVVDTGSRGFFGNVEYSVDLFNATTIERLVNNYVQLLHSIADNPTQKICELSLLTKSEQRQLLIQWNNTKADLIQDILIHQLFEQQVEKRPAAVAVVFGDQYITYDDLNRRANRLAHGLRLLGAKDSDLVAVLMDRSLEMIIALFGILKAGCAYIPLEANWPNKRIKDILNKTNVEWILTNGLRIKTVHTIRREIPKLIYGICIDQSDYGYWSIHDASKENMEKAIITPMDNLPDTNPPSHVSSDTFAYMIFTSGSTGQPKGIIVQHKPVINLIDWVKKTFHLGSSDRILLVTSLCFDLSVFDIFGLLAVGSSIRIVSEMEIQDPEQIGGYLVDDMITIWDSTPASMGQLIQIFSKSDMASTLQLALLSGDWIPVDLPDKIRHIFTQCKVISLGGATEATVWSNYFPIETVDPLWTSIPYGKPIQNTSYYILDAQMNLCPIGVEGDLYIGGECLSLGYYRQPTLTGEQYIPEPFTGQLGKRIYRTGDRARYWEDGNIEFCGRKDRQVKVRGYRIELGEIETALLKHASTREVVVVDKTDINGVTYLVSYIVIEPAEQQPNADELRTFLGTKLPEYMIPAAFVFLDTLPLSVNGKVDRKMLPVPDRNSLKLQKAFILPSSATEIQIEKIWREVLDLDRIGIHDNFFQLGGHSMLVAQVVSRMRSAFRLEFPLRIMFESPTIAQIACFIEQSLCYVPAASVDLGSSLVLIQNGKEGRTPIFFVHGGDGSVFPYIALARQLGETQPFYGLQARGLETDEPPYTNLEKMAEYYVQLIQTVQTEGPYWLGGWSLGGIVALDMVNRLCAKGQEVAYLILLDTQLQIIQHVVNIDSSSLVKNFAVLSFSNENNQLEYVQNYIESISMSECFRQMDPEEMLTHLWEQARSNMALTIDMSLESFCRMFRVYQSNIQALNSYVPKSCSCPIVIFKTQEHLKKQSLDIESGWSDLATAGLSVYEVPGNHFTLLQEPNISVLAGILKGYLPSK